MVNRKVDAIRLHGMRFFGHHGVFEEEKRLGQRFFVDVDLFLDLQKAGKSDRLSDTIHYGKVYDRVKAIVEGPPKKLIEAVAETIARDLLENFPKLQACRVNIVKPGAPIPGSLDSVSVEIYRERER
jgi:dihydroneopterin aldolase